MLLKRESHNPTGSVKDRTALGLITAMHQAEPLRPGTVVVESTSGNLGVALARLLSPLDCSLTAIIDPKTPERTSQALIRAGAEVHCATEPDDCGGYLLTRLRMVEDLCRAHPAYRWSDQYRSPANPMVHQQTTGPEILIQGGPDLDAVYVAVSTGGTLAGVAAHVRPSGRPIRIVAVDAQSSRASGPAVNGRRLLPGIGSSWRSSFLRPDSYDHVARVADADAIAMCRMLVEDTGIRVGGSSGAVLHACVTDLAGPRPPRRPLCLCADGGGAYADSVYHDGWLTQMDLTGPVRRSMERFRAAGLRFAAAGTGRPPSAVTELPAPA